MSTISKEQIAGFAQYLRESERSDETVTKYERYAAMFAGWLGERELTKEVVITFKAHISETYTAVGVNGILAAVNGLLKHLERSDLQVKYLKIQRRRYTEPERELSRQEAERLIAAAITLGRERSALFIRTMLATGIRVSELRFITVEAVKSGYAEVKLKGKVREVIIPDALQKLLIDYAERNEISSGSIFVTRTGKPLDRSYIWKEMKKLAEQSTVAASKAYPHALRHCFAREYYAKYPKLAELADILGHSNAETTRIYTASPLESYRYKINSLGLAA
jgi:site-specific recombinase XerD